MSKPRSQISMFDRFRRLVVLRVLFVTAAMLASQSSLACAVGNLLESQQTEISVDEAGEQCCSLCIDCANCGACCGFAVSLRPAVSARPLASVVYTNISSATAAPTLWTPPALLRPPISAI